jgi:formate hydrogenlyase transcriptional activator
MDAQNNGYQSSNLIEEICCAEREGSPGMDSADLRTHEFIDIVGNSKPLVEALRLVRTVGPTDSTVLIEGETGTGKELVARAIHNLSARRGRPFVKLNCSAIPFDLLESDLFGHEKGAFTGAIAQKMGRFEMADTGTIFLDEIGDMPLALQPKLLRVLQEQEFERLGSGRTHRVNVRLVTATHRDLKQMVKKNEFRSDLYYRLNVFPVVLPTLRERREDIEPLVSHFIDLFSRRMHKQIDCIPLATMEAFTSYSWPGNVRELQNMVERAVIRSDGGVLKNPFPVCDGNALAINSVQHSTASVLPFVRARTFIDAQRNLIVQALNATGWVVGGPKGAATRLGLKRTTLISKMKKLGVCRALWSNQLDEPHQSFETLSSEQPVA